jgi:hypothetical protein
MTDFIPGLDPSILKEAQEQEKEQKKKDLESVQVITDIAQLVDGFCSWGYSSELKITRGDEVKKVKFKIKSIGMADVIAQYQENAPRAPSIVKGYKKGTPEAQALGSKYDVIVREIDESDPNYLRLREKADTEAGQMMVLNGLALDLKDLNGNVVVRGADVRVANEIINREEGLKALYRLGMSASHFTTLVRDIRNLTEDAEAAERQE